MRFVYKAIIIYILTTLVITFPSALNLSGAIIGDGGDNLQFLSFQHAANREFEKGNFPYSWTNYLRYPVGFDLSKGSDSVLFLTGGILFYRFFSDPVLVYNLTVLSFLVLNQIISFLFFRRLSGDNYSALIGGFIYGLSFYVIARAGGHANLILTGTFPLFLLSIINIIDKKGNFSSFVKAALVLILLLYSSLQYLLILAGSFLVLFPLLGIFFIKYFRKFITIIFNNKLNTVLSIVIFIFFFLLFHGGRLEDMIHGTIVFPSSEVISVPMISFLAPNTYLKIPNILANFSSDSWIEYALYLGWAEISLFLLYFLFVRKEARRKIFILLGSVMIFILMLGDRSIFSFSLPYKYLFDYFPFRGIIEPGRFYVVLYIFITYGAVSAVSKLYKRYGKVLLFFIAAVLLFERLPVGFYLTEGKITQDYVFAVRELESEAVLDLPTYIDWNNGNLYDLLAVWYQKPIVNGYIHWSGDNQTSRELLSELYRFNCDSAKEGYFLKGYEEYKIFKFVSDERTLDILKAYGIKTIVFHKNLFLDNQGCQEAEVWINRLVKNPRLEVIYSDSETNVYKIR